MIRDAKQKHPTSSLEGETKTKTSIGCRALILISVVFAFFFFFMRYSNGLAVARLPLVV